MTCGKCGDLIRAHKPTGCVIRDPKTFMPFYKEFLEIKRNSLLISEDKDKFVKQTEIRGKR